jgi:hypothetical protein
MPDRIYVVGVGYALIGEFVGAQGVAPVTRETKSRGGRPPRVVFRGPWKGITATFTAAKAGLANSLFEISPGADPGSIKLRYNVNVDLQRDGALRFRNPYAESFLRQAAPVAWQTIRGARRRVEVAYKVSDGRTVGFSVGDYDSSYPLIIDPAYRLVSRAATPVERYPGNLKFKTLPQPLIRGEK